MSDSWEQYVRRLMSGESRGMAAAVLRAGLAGGEMVYRPVMSLRNRLFDRAIKRVHQLPRPVISVGNITAGGTGKTPVVRWLADSLRATSRRPAVLLRGYRKSGALHSDEAVMLDRLLNADQPEPRVHVEAHPDRLAGAERALRADPRADVFILDDGFQHRRVARNFDLVLINAAEPFGYGHVHPRGLLREPMSGLSRANGFVLTHSDEVGAKRLDDIEGCIRRYNAAAPIYRAEHRQTGLRSAGSPEGGFPLDLMHDKPFFAFAGIGNPASLQHRLESFGGCFKGRRWFADHHAYTPADLASLRQVARDAGAQILVTTEKDWSRLDRLPGAMDPALPILRIEMQIHFWENDELRLLEQIHQCISEPTGASTASSRG